MFSVITNIYNKKTKGPNLMELFTATGTLKTFFLQLEMFDGCTTGDTAHIDTIFKYLPYTRQHESGHFLTTYTRIA
jgi:phosphoribosylpyrophosphate synthetase